MWSEFLIKPFFQRIFKHMTLPKPNFTSLIGSVAKRRKLLLILRIFVSYICIEKTSFRQKGQTIFFGPYGILLLYHLKERLTDIVAIFLAR